ncbi:MAG TPA: hypothetical protein VGG48_10135 [Rhizomicrobium sp.]|jgi:hypothetical protein
MTPICTFIFASLCVPQAYAPVTQTDAMYTVAPHGFDPAAERRLGVEVDVWQSDLLRMVLPIAVDRACTRDWCTYYQRHCSATDCVYEISSPIRSDPDGGVALNIEIKIHARSKAILRKTVRDLALAMGPDDAPPVAYLPLASLDHETIPHQMKGCSRSVWFQGCGRPPLPEAGRPTQL